MRTYQLTLPHLGLIAGTRMALGIGIGFLLAPRLRDDQRRAAGWALVAIGALTTVPLLVQVFGSATPSPSAEPGQPPSAFPIPPSVPQAIGR